MGGRHAAARLPFSDYAGMARSFGMHAERVTDANELPAAIARDSKNDTDAGTGTNAALAIIMAVVPGAGATMFVADMVSEGILIECTKDSLGTYFPGGHAVVRFDNLRVATTTWTCTRRA